MILPTMNKLEINLHIVKAIKHYNTKLKTTMLTLNKKWKKTPMAKVCKSEIIEWRSEHQKFIAVWSRMLGYCGFTMMAVVNHGKNQWVYSFLANLFDTMEAYSMHFYKRYAERTGKPFLFPVIVGRHQVINRHRFKIYEGDGGNNTVYACREGIELCRWDKERGITKFCTFVSHSMLGDTQREAWKLVQSKMDEADEICKRDIPIEEKQALVYKWSNSSPDLLELAASVYDKYYQEIYD